MRLSSIGWNLFGLVTPLLVAVLTIPPLVDRLGAERFGLLALAWGLVGYAGALDLGIGRALTQLIAAMRGEAALSGITDALATARRITLLSGIAGGLLISALALSIGGSWANAGETPETEIVAAMLLLALALPAQSMSATYRGVNEAFENFRNISLLRIALGAINFGGPFLLSFHTTELPALVATIVVSRIAALGAYRRLAFACIDRPVPSVGEYSPALARRLFAFGGWVTVSSIVSPVLVQADRFVIATVMSASIVTLYVLPYEVAVQSLVFAGAVTSVAFPALSRFAKEAPGRLRPYFDLWLVRLAALMLVLCGTLMAVLPWLLQVWLGPRLDPVSIEVGQILCIGVFANSLGSMFYALLHARGRADLTAKLHLAELPVFLVALFVLVDAYGVVGAAWAWVGRMIFDASALAALSRPR